jgi:Fe-S-cluster containining protein
MVMHSPPDPVPPAAAPGECNGCGACCRVLTLEQSPAEIQGIAAITSVLGIPSDHVFAAAHWRPLTRDEAMQRNPFYTARLPQDAHLYTCDQLGADGRCLSYDARPLVCRGYPWYGEAPRAMALADPDCGYRVDRPAASD